jgi:hypothetical protein
MCVHIAQDDSKRVISFVNQADYISFRHHTYEAPRGAKSVALTGARPVPRSALGFRPPSAACALLCLAFAA